MPLEDDIVDSETNLKNTEKILGRIWTFEDDEERGNKWLNDWDRFERLKKPKGALAQKEPNNTPRQVGNPADQHNSTQMPSLAQAKHGHHHHDKHKHRKVKKHTKKAGSCPFAK